MSLSVRIAVADDEPRNAVSFYQEALPLAGSPGGLRGPQPARSWSQGCQTHHPGTGSSPTSRCPIWDGIGRGPCRFPRNRAGAGDSRLREGQVATGLPITGGKPGRIPVLSSMVGANSVGFRLIRLSNQIHTRIQSLCRFVSPAFAPPGALFCLVYRAFFTFCWKIQSCFF